MIATIDKAGRVVIPLDIRKSAQLKPGSQLNVEFKDGKVSLTRDVPGPKLVRSNGRLIARPTAKELPDVDLPASVSEERNRWPL